MKNVDDVDTPMIALVGITGSVLLFVLIVALLAWFNWSEQKELRQKVVEPANQKIQQLDAKQLESINIYRVVDAKKGLIAVPIDRAMGLVLKDIATSRTRTLEQGRNETGKNGG